MWQNWPTSFRLESGTADLAGREQPLPQLLDIDDELPYIEKQRIKHVTEAGSSRFSREKSWKQGG